MPRRTPVMLLVAVLLLVPALALPYGVAIHDLLPRHALASAGIPGLAGGLSGALPGATDADLDAFRLLVYQRASRSRDTSLRSAFLARYPSADSFSVRAFKQLMMMNGEARVLGVDSFAAVYRTIVPSDRRLDPHPDYVAGRPISLAEALELGSIYPDLDRRNQARLVRDANGAPALTRAGDSIPFDPMTLNMGRLSGLSSQAHAHYGLNRHPKSDDPATLKNAPWDFAIATGFQGEVITFGPDNAQLYTDLALVAALDGRPGLRTLSALYAGNALHYIADVGNAVHTIQVGIYPIFVDATIQAWLDKLRTLFGLLGTPRSRNSIGIDIISNLHSLSEELFQYQLVTALHAADSGSPGLRAALRGLGQGDDSLARALADTLRGLAAAGIAPDFGRAVAATVVDANYRDGAEVYRVTREIIAPALRKGRRTVDFDTVPDEQVWRFVKAGRDAPALDTFNLVHARGIARTTSALRGWWSEYTRLAALRGAARDQVLEAVVTRLVRERLDYLAEAERRREAWLEQWSTTER